MCICLNIGIGWGKVQKRSLTSRQQPEAIKPKSAKQIIATSQFVANRLLTIFWHFDFDFVFLFFLFRLCLHWRHLAKLTIRFFRTQLNTLNVCAHFFIYVIFHLFSAFFAFPGVNEYVRPHILIFNLYFYALLTSFSLNERRQL